MGQEVASQAVASEGRLDVFVVCREDDRPQHEVDPYRDIGPALAMDADDIRFTFPGDNSFAPGANDKREHEQWLNRFVSLGLQIYPDQVILKGLPWHQTICVRGHVHLDDPKDGCIYDNRYVIWGRIAWGSCASMRSTRTPKRAGSSTNTWRASGRRSERTRP